jgi:prepilin-type N-terminal cleavage/methylation domain-containing protein/prepilin-type processing-associated H-X9-DG protein
MMNTPNRRGLTLVELLAVIAIIGLLVAMLMPALQNARESARRASCGNNLRQVALAMQAYHNSMNSLPPGFAGCCLGTWFHLLPPYIEQAGAAALYSNWGALQNNAGYYAAFANRAFGEIRFPIFTCPSDAPATMAFSGSLFAKHNYVANNGNTAINNVGGVPGPSAGGQSMSQSLNGVAYGGGPFVVVDVDRGVVGGVPFAAIRDGLSTTLMLSETVQGKETASSVDVRGATFWGNGSGFTAYSGPNSSDPDYYWSSGGCNVPFADNPPCAGFSSSNPGRQSARSRHPQGVNAAMCDGAVRFVDNAIFIDTWRALSTTKGREAADVP